MVSKLKITGPKLTMLRTIFRAHPYGYAVSCEGRPPFDDRDIQELIRKGYVRYDRHASWTANKRTTVLFVTASGAEALGEKYVDPHVSP
jgi:hypothetical protein